MKWLRVSKCSNNAKEKTNYPSPEKAAAWRQFDAPMHTQCQILCDLRDTEVLPFKQPEKIEQNFELNSIDICHRAFILENSYIHYS